MDSKQQDQDPRQQAIDALHAQAKGAVAMADWLSDQDGDDMPDVGLAPHSPWLTLNCTDWVQFRQCADRLPASDGVQVVSTGRIVGHSFGGGYRVDVFLGLAAARRSETAA